MARQTAQRKGLRLCFSQVALRMKPGTGTRCSASLRVANRIRRWPSASDGGRAHPTVAERSRGPRLRSGTGKLSNTQPRLRSVTGDTGRAWPRCFLTTALSWRLQSPFSILHSPFSILLTVVGGRAKPTVANRNRRSPSVADGGRAHPTVAERSQRWPSVAEAQPP